MYRRGSRGFAEEDLFASLAEVDQLCNIQEKIDQVQAMDLIYQRASRVLIYLGEADDYSDSAIDAIAERKTSTGSIQKKVLDFFKHRP